jgi:DNA-binding LacI/PurR family transcriptional regulator
MAVTIKDIARKANVTPTTVSLSLRGRPGVSLEKREEIKTLARQLGYRPSFLGRGLQGGKTHSLGILWSLCGPHLSMEVTRDLTLRAQKREYISYVVDSLSDPGIVNQTLEDFARRRVDALIIECNWADKILDQLKLFPSVVVVGKFPQTIPMDYVHYDRTSGIRQMAKHFIAAGRHRPLVLYHGEETNFFKIQAFLSEFQEQDIPVNPERLFKMPTVDPQEVTRILEEYYSDKPIDVDAIFGMTDHTAAAAMKWFKQRGIRIPDDVAVCGFNDDDLCEFFEPPLASVHRNHKRLSEEIDSMIFTRLSQPNLPPRNVTIPMTFVPRASAG